MISEKHAEALAYARDGIPVFPCVVNGKEPACAGGFKAATTDEQQINRWWGTADYNIGVCPDDAGWAVLDIDPGGLEEWNTRFARSAPARTATVRTPRGGWHFYFRGRLPSSTNRLAKGIDTRGVGGYVLVPPSRVIDPEKGIDDVYQWADENEAASVPDWLSTALEKPETKNSVAKGAPVERSHLENLLRHCGTAETSRNEWRDIVAAIRACNLGDNEAENLSLALAWSRGELSPDNTPPGNYDGDEAVEECFESMPPKEDGVGYGTILHYAREGGYRGPSALPIQTAAEAFGAAKLDTQAKASQQSTSKWQPIHISKFQGHFKEPQWLIPDLLPAQGIVQLIGQRKSFKSFLATDMALGLATGSTTFGFSPTRRVSCVYCVGENANSFALRHVPAWLLARGLRPDPDIPFHVIPNVPKASYEDEVNDMISAILALGIKPELIVIDTLTRMMRALDSNADVAVGQVMQALENIRDVFGCTVMGVRHMGKDLSRGSKGSGIIDDDDDTNLLVERHEKSPAVKLTVKDQRNAQEREEPFYFEAQAIPGFSLIMKPIAAAEYLQYAGAEAQFTRKHVGAALQALGVPVTTQVLAEALLPHKEGQGAEARHSAVTRAAGTINRLAGTVLQGYWEGIGSARRWSLAPEPDVPV